jgi:hypothetical protein
MAGPTSGLSAYAVGGGQFSIKLAEKRLYPRSLDAKMMKGIDWPSFAPTFHPSGRKISMADPARVLAATSARGTSILNKPSRKAPGVEEPGCKKTIVLENASSD